MSDQSTPVTEVSTSRPSPWPLFVALVLLLVFIAGSRVWGFSWAAEWLEELLVMVLAGLAAAYWKLVGEVWTRVTSVGRFLSVRTAVEPISKSIADLPQEVRIQYGQSLGQISGAWFNVLKKVAGRKECELLVSLFERYALEEAKDVGGDTGKHFFVTNFVAYSELVRAIVRTTLDRFPNDSVVCFTTLVMRLPKWFNFREGEHCEVHKGWEDYKGDLLKLLRAENVSLARCLVVADDKCSAHALVDLPFHYERELREDANRQLLIPTDNGLPEWNNFRPLRGEDVQQLGLYADTVVGAALGQLYPAESKRRAYVICPPNAVPDTQRLPHHQWMSLGRAFAMLYHDPYDEQCKYFTLDEDALNARFRHKDERKNMPEDLFMVGLETGGSCEWLCCLAGDVDSKINYVSLEFVTDGLNKSRFDRIKKYVKNIDDKSKQLIKLCKVS